MPNIRGLGVRLLAASGGIALALGLTGLVFGLVGWYGHGGFTPRPFLGVAIATAVGGWILRRRQQSPALRTAATVALWSSVMTLMTCAANSGLIDTKTASYKGRLLGDLHSEMLAQYDFLRDSGRYVASLPPDFTLSSRVTAHQLALTRDGWTMSVTDGEEQRTCVVFVGSTPIEPATREGWPACSRPPLKMSAYMPLIALMIAGASLILISYRLERR